MPRSLTTALTVTCFAIILIPALVTAQEGQPPAASSLASLDAAFGVVREAVEKDNVPGAIALVAQRGKIVREEAFGLCDVENNRPMTPTTLCWIASITKPVTVAAAMKLVESGKLGLDDAVEEFLPEFKTQKDREGRHHVIKVRHLMSHTSGIQPNPPTRPSFFFEAGWMSRKIAEIPPLIAQTTLEFAPGSQVHYSNAAPYVLGRIIELRSGLPFHEFVDQNIFKPAGMNDTFFVIPPAAAPRVAVVYRATRDGRVTFGRFDPAWNVTMTMPDGGLFSYPGEIAKFVQIFLDDNHRVLSHDTVRSMLKSEAPCWGLGWALDEDGLFHHEGSSGTSAWGDSKSGIVGILFCQVQNPAKIDPLQARFRDAVRAAYRSAAAVK